MGFSSELPPVSSRASTVPSCSSHRATSTLSSSQKPPGTPSDMLSLAVTAMRFADGLTNGLQDLSGKARTILQ